MARSASPEARGLIENADRYPDTCSCTDPNAPYCRVHDEPAPTSPAPTEEAGTAEARNAVPHLAVESGRLEAFADAVNRGVHDDRRLVAELRAMARRLYEAGAR